jgi:hypothetical protein
MAGATGEGLVDKPFPCKTVISLCETQMRWSVCAHHDHLIQRGRQHFHNEVLRHPVGLIIRILDSRMLAEAGRRRMEYAALAPVRASLAQRMELMATPAELGESSTERRSSILEVFLEERRLRLSIFRKMVADPCRTRPEGGKAGLNVCAGDRFAHIFLSRAIAQTGKTARRRLANLSRFGIIKFAVNRT